MGKALGQNFKSFPHSFEFCSDPFSTIISHHILLPNILYHVLKFVHLKPKVLKPGEFDPTWQLRREKTVLGGWFLTETRKNETYPVLRLEGPNVSEICFRDQKYTFGEIEGPKTYLSLKNMKSIFRHL